MKEEVGSNGCPVKLESWLRTGAVTNKMIASKEMLISNLLCTGRKFMGLPLLARVSFNLA
ncbi:MAG: hypothetical protein M5U34_30820 [Chloroflexi bacterium]|nr:hypothetical protein [Chloroflexota bacterium]